MTETFEIIDSNKGTIYKFRFGTSNDFVHLTQQQVDRIPYLAALVAHKDDFLSTRNENGEYVLNSPIKNTFLTGLCDCYFSIRYVVEL